MGGILLKPKDRLMCHLNSVTSVTDGNNLSNSLILLVSLMKAISIDYLRAMDFYIFSSVHYMKVVKNIIFAYNNHVPDLSFKSLAEVYFGKRTWYLL